VCVNVLDIRCHFLIPHTFAHTHSLCAPSYTVLLTQNTHIRTHTLTVCAFIYVITHSKHTHSHTHTHSVCLHICYHSLRTHTFTHPHSQSVRKCPSYTIFLTDSTGGGDRTENNYDCQSLKHVFMGVHVNFRHVFTVSPKIQTRFYEVKGSPCHSKEKTRNFLI